MSEAMIANNTGSAGGPGNGAVIECIDVVKCSMA
jgi:hypothetical protein